jgi:DNA adenine methylase
MATPDDILTVTVERVSADLVEPIVRDMAIAARIEEICRSLTNRACARFILACTLAKAHRPEVDIRKPYTEIPGSESYSGRTYDESYITAFVLKHSLPC